VTAKEEAARGQGLAAPIAGLDPTEQRALFGQDAWPYGLEPNRRTLETFLEFTAALGWIDNPKPIEEYFVPATLDLRG
jgi:4,5-dihydroxyphthalate decarboxylase